MSEGPLVGVKILDAGSYMAGPFASRLLADLGATVIKLEAVEGDQLRALIRAYSASQRGKRGIAVQLKDPDGQAIARKLAAWADIVSQNMRPGADQRLGIDYESVRALNPEVIYVASPGWGASGPEAKRPGMAPLYSALTGVHFEVGGEGNPPLMPVGNEDPTGGLVGAMAMLMALLHRRRTGRGQYIESPQLNATMLQAMHVMVDGEGNAIGAHQLDHEQMGMHALDRLYRTSDGWICIVVEDDDAFTRLCDALDVGALGTDPRFADVDSRRANTAALADVLTPVFAATETAHCHARLDAAGVACAVPNANGETTFFADERNVASGRVVEHELSKHGRTREIGLMIRLSDTPGRSAHQGPALGEHSVEILRELGFEDDQIDDFVERRVVVATPHGL